jgi:hypothetical protein|uniref:hypothetical protein n=1 Tax=Gelidibacter sp. TaxID=2018083 RepID=UPI00404B1EC6
MPYLNISYYKSQRTKLLKLVYPNDNWIGIGKIIFKQTNYKGITARLWRDQIEILFDDTFLDCNPEFLNQAAIKLDILSENFEYKIRSNRITILPIGRNEFPDTKIGMKNRAALYVLTLVISLKAILNK